MNWLELIGGGLGVAVVRVIADIIKSIRKERKLVPSRSLLKVNEIYTNCMKPVIDRTNAVRFTVARIENSGGPLVPGSDLYLSIAYEDYQRPFVSIIEQFQRWKLDKQYLELLNAVIEHGSAIVEVEKLPLESKQRVAYEEQGIKYAEVYFIAQTKNKLFIATISTDCPNLLIQGRMSRTQIDSSINNLRTIFYEYYRK